MFKILNETFVHEHLKISHKGASVKVGKVSWTSLLRWADMMKYIWQCSRKLRDAVQFPERMLNDVVTT